MSFYLVLAKFPDKAVGPNEEDLSADGVLEDQTVRPGCQDVSAVKLPPVRGLRPHHRHREVTCHIQKRAGHFSCAAHCVPQTNTLCSKGHSLYWPFVKTGMTTEVKNVRMIEVNLCPTRLPCGPLLFREREREQLFCRRNFSSTCQRGVNFS